MKRGLRFLLAAALTAAALWLSFRHVEPADLLRDLGRVRWPWVFLAAANMIASVWVLAFRWRILLRPRGVVGTGRLFVFQIISQTVNMAMPARMGDLARAYLAHKEGGASIPYVFGTLVAERLLDASVFVGLALSAPAALSAGQSLMPARGTALLLLLPVLFLVSLVGWPRLYERTAAFLARLAPAGTAARLRGIASDGLDAFALFRRTGALVGLLAWTGLLLLGQIASNVMLLKAFSIPLGFGAGLMILLAVQLISLPPSAPGKIGVFEYAVVLVLTAYGVTPGLALSYGIMLHIVVFAPKIGLALAFLAGGRLRGALREARTTLGRNKPGATE